MTITIFAIYVLTILMLVIVLNMIIQVKNVMSELKHLKVLIVESNNVANYVKDHAEFLDNHFLKLNVVYSAITNFKDDVRKMTDSNRDLKAIVRTYDRNQIESNLRLNDKLNDITTIIAHESVTINHINYYDKLKSEALLDEDNVVDDTIVGVEK